MDERIAALIAMVPGGDWQRIRDRVAALKQSAEVVRGDRRSARAANTAGLRLLEAGSVQDAVAQFEISVRTDPADVEARNNLGYALVKAGRQDDAVLTLSQLLLLAPDRTSAWANLSEAMARKGEAANAVSSLKLAVYFSSNRDKTVGFLQQAKETHESIPYRAVVVQVIDSLSMIPVDAGPTSERKAVAVVSERAPRATNVGPAPAPRTSTGSDSSVAIQGLVRQAQSAMEGKRYQEAIAVGRSVLAIDSNNEAARQIVRQASDAQRRDLENIEIK
jgi:hypothetical protein